MAKIKFLSGRDMRQVVTMAEAITAVREAFIQLSNGNVMMPQRTTISIQKRKGKTHIMPAYLSSNGALGVKIVSDFPGNRARNMPIIHGVVIVLDKETGRPLAVMDGAYLTALRTGATSAVATDLLAKKDAHIAALFGAGVQAHTQLEAICNVRSIKKIWVYDCVKEIAEAFVKEMKSFGNPISSNILVAESPAQAVREADIVCTVTTSLKPVFNNDDLKKGVLINGFGSFTPEMQEIPPQTVLRSKVIVDSLNASLIEAGDLIVPIKEGLITEQHIHGEIGQVAAGYLSGRESNDEIIFFKSVGLAVQDVAVAESIYLNAEKLGVGLDVEL